MDAAGSASAAVDQARGAITSAAGDRAPGAFASADANDLGVETARFRVRIDERTGRADSIERVNEIVAPAVELEKVASALQR